MCVYWRADAGIVDHVSNNVVDLPLFPYRVHLPNEN